MSGTSITQLGRYRILGEVGRGAMGVVYKAEDPQLNRIVAIKTIHMAADLEERAEYEARFHQEAKAAAGLNHPNIITVHDIGREDDVIFMAMELLEGTEVRELMERGRLPLALALDIAADVADGLAFAHERGVIHRDIKPGNVMVVHGRHAKIMDFGIARVRVSDVKTQTGAILGSPKYMSPEQVNGQRADHRSDIFSLGVMTYELAAGAAPFSGATLGELMLDISAGALRPPTTVNAALPPVFDLIVAKALEKDPAARYQNATEMARDLRACRSELGDMTDAAPAATKGAGTDSQLTVVSSPHSVQDTPTHEATRTQKANLSAQRTMRLPLSRRFDSSQAIHRVAAHDSDDTPAAATPQPALIHAFQRLLKDPERRGLTIAVLVGIIVGLVITFA
jgi:eukaryotic-like serine/threonine-protein kinase